MNIKNEIAEIEASTARIRKIREALEAELAALDETEPLGECDCCARQRPLSRVIAFGIETFACEGCRQWDERGRRS
jgi:hypothetical protein